MIKNNNVFHSRMQARQKRIKVFWQQKDTLRGVCSALIIFGALCVISLILRAISSIIQYICPNALIIVDPSSVNFSFVAILFTILGFGVTLKNIIISKDSVTYNLFSIKAIIEEGNTLISSASWYLIICIPFYSVILYALGCRRQLYFLLLLSASAFIVHFFTIIIRLQKKSCKKTVAYIIINNLFDKDKRRTEYRKEIFQKLVNSDESKAESNMIFSESVNILSDIITGKESFICSKRHLLTKTAIQKKIKDRWDEFNSCDKAELIKSYSLYVFDYFNSVFKDSSAAEYDYLVVQFTQLFDHFVDDHFKKEDIIKIYLQLIQRNILDCIEAAPEISCTQFMENITKEKMEKEFWDYVYLYTLIINTVLGLLAACITNMGLNNIKCIINNISDTLNKKLFLSDSIINLLSLYILYYAVKNNRIKENITYREFYTFLNDLYRDVSCLYSGYIESQVFESFTVFDYKHYFYEIFEIVKSDINNHIISLFDYEEDSDD